MATWAEKVSDKVKFSAEANLSQLRYFVEDDGNVIAELPSNLLVKRAILSSLEKIGFNLETKDPNINFVGSTKNNAGKEFSGIRDAVIHGDATVLRFNEAGVKTLIESDVKNEALYASFGKRSLGYYNGVSFW